MNQEEIYPKVCSLEIQY